MHELMIAAAGFAAIAVAASIAGMSARDDAAMYERLYRAEVRRHDQTLAQTNAALEYMHGERVKATAQIWALSVALADATAQVEAGRAQGGVKLAADLRQGDDGLLSRFCRN